MAILATTIGHARAAARSASPSLRDFGIIQSLIMMGFLAIGISHGIAYQSYLPTLAAISTRLRDLAGVRLASNSESHPRVSTDPVSGAYNLRPLPPRPGRPLTPHTVFNTRR
jgi:hypothetical protein